MGFHSGFLIAAAITQLCQCSIKNGNDTMFFACSIEGRVDFTTDTYFMIDVIVETLTIMTLCHWNTEARALV